MSELVLYEVRGSAAILTLNRADRRNALSRALISAIDDAMARAADDSAVRSVILTGNGPTFCAGMDLAELQESLVGGSELAPVWDDALRLARVYDRIYTLPKPTVAAVNGAAVAGGAGLVSVCDLAVSVPEAKFGYPEVRRGLVAAMVMPHLMRHVGERMARYLLLTGDLIDADEACRAGFLNAVAPTEKLLETALIWAALTGRGRPRGPGSDEGSAGALLTAGAVHRGSGESVGGATADTRSAGRGWRRFSPSERCRG